MLEKVLRAYSAVAKPLAAKAGSSFFVTTTNEEQPDSAGGLPASPERSRLRKKSSPWRVAVASRRGERTTNDERRTTNEERRTKAALCAAFSLIEVTLALMVVSVGILAILGLFPMGLDQNSRAIAESHAGLFADEVFSGLRAQAETNWSGLSAGTVLSPVVSPNVSLDQISFSGTNLSVFTNVYSNTATHIVDHALRYRLTLSSNGNIKAAMLCVWDGRFGTTSAPNVFYEEFFNYKP